jgi:predicted enzyme related to lactoylglutathione lyase
VPKMIHFEIPADNVDRAVKFYADVFGWKAQKYAGSPTDYRTVTTGDEKEMGINGAIMARGQEKCVIDTIGVPDVDKFLKKITAAGGKALTKKMPVPGMGYFAYFQDTEGNKLGVFTVDMSAKMGD